MSYLPRDRRRIIVNKDDIETLGLMTLTIIKTPEHKIVEEFMENEHLTVGSAVKRITDLSNQALVAPDPLGMDRQKEPLRKHVWSTMASIIELGSVYPPGKAHDRLTLFLDTLRVVSIKDPKGGWVIQMGVTENERAWMDLPSLHQATYTEIRWYDITRPSTNWRQRVRHENLVHLLARWTARGEMSCTRSPLSPLDYTNKALLHISDAFQPLLRIRNRPGVASVLKPTLASVRLACIWITYDADYFWRECLKGDRRIERSAELYPATPGLDEFSTWSWNLWLQALDVAVEIIESGRSDVEFRDGAASSGTTSLVKKAHELVKKDRARKF